MRSKSRESRDGRAAEKNFPELDNYEVRMRYFREMNDRNRDELVKYWSQALEKYFEKVKAYSCDKYGDLESYFVVDRLHVASFPEILAILASQGQIMLLENLDVDVERKLIDLRPEVKYTGESNDGVLSTLVNLFFYRLPPSDSRELPLKNYHYVVHLKTLEKVLEKYLVKDFALLRNQAFRDQVFLPRQQLEEFIESQGDTVYDALLVIYALIERKVIHPDRQRDPFGRVVRGFVIHDPSSEEYRLHAASQKIKNSIEFLDQKIEELEKKCSELHQKILSNLRMMNKEVARTLGREKIKMEKQIVMLINKKTMLFEAREHLQEAINGGGMDECWQIIRDLGDKKIMEIDDIKNTIENMNLLKEANNDLNGMIGHQSEEDDRELQKEMERLEAEVKIDAMLSPSRKKNTMDAERVPDGVNLLHNPFPTTFKKPDQQSANPLLGGVSTDKNESRLESLFGNNYGLRDAGLLQQSQSNTAHETKKDIDNPFSFH